MGEPELPTLGFDYSFTDEDMRLCAMALGITAESIRRGNITLGDERQTEEVKQKCAQLRGLLCAAMGFDVQPHVDEPKK